MAASLVKETFPRIDADLFSYIESVLESCDDFQSVDDVYDAIGAIVQQAAEEKTEDTEQGGDLEQAVRDLCLRVFHCLNVHDSGGGGINGGHSVKLLQAPVHIGSETRDDAALSKLCGKSESVWMTQRDAVSRVDARKLEKAEERIRRKQLERQEAAASSVNTVSSSGLDTGVATVSQAVSRRMVRASAADTAVQDIRLDNFDLSFGERVLLETAQLSLVFGRRYGLVGRNGLGKSTLLRALATRQLSIPSHVSVLHVEQEVVGDATTALQSVLECDERRHQLLRQQRDLEQQLEAVTAGDDLSAQLTDVYAQLEAIEADKAPARAAVILRGLGFSPDMQQQATREFSGGWRMRLALARALFAQPDLLLLDEPTNMLDMKAIIWLEQYLQKWPSTLLVVSHDRHFLELVPTDMLHLHSRRLDAYRGGYLYFVKQQEERLKNQQREYDAQMALRAHAQAFIDKFRYNAKRASLAQSKIKMLERLPVLEPVIREPPVVLRLPSTQSLAPPVLQLDEVAFRYTSSQDTGKEQRRQSSSPVFSNVNLSADMQSRICIVGENGAGKTTLLKILIGALEPTEGLRHINKNLKIGYFAQHHVDQLSMGVTCVELLASRCPGQSVEQYRRQLGSFGLTGTLAAQQVSTLSGGQKSRLALAALCAEQPNFFILDEPTNHLDLETIEALGVALQSFGGGVVLVSHDERLIRAVCRQLWVCGGGSVRQLDGGFDEYRDMVKRELDDI